jgi:hypothetical protein
MERIHLVPTQPLPVDPYSCGRHYPFAIEEDVTSSGFGRKLEQAPIGRNRPVRLVIKAVPGQAKVRVRNRNLLKSRIVKLARLGTLDDVAVVSPVQVDSQHKPGACSASLRTPDQPGAGGKRSSVASAYFVLSKITKVLS